MSRSALRGRMGRRTVRGARDAHWRHLVKKLVKICKVGQDYMMRRVMVYRRRLRQRDMEQHDGCRTVWCALQD